jgi:hypothetical protein
VGDGDGDCVSVFGALDLGLMMPSSLSISSCEAVQVQREEEMNKIRGMDRYNDVSIELQNSIWSYWTIYSNLSIKVLPHTDTDKHTHTAHRHTHTHDYGSV